MSFQCNLNHLSVITILSKLMFFFVYSDTTFIIIWSYYISKNFNASNKYIRRNRIPLTTTIREFEKLREVPILWYCCFTAFLKQKKSIVWKDRNGKKTTSTSTLCNEFPRYWIKDLSEINRKEKDSKWFVRKFQI